MKINEGDNVENKLAITMDGLELVETVWRQTGTMDEITMKIVRERLAQIERVE